MRTATKPVQVRMKSLGVPVSVVTLTVKDPISRHQRKCWKRQSECRPSKQGMYSQVGLANTLGLPFARLEKSCSVFIVLWLKAENAFTKVGFCNWKKASQCFVKHENSHAHSEACMKIHSKTNVATLLSEACRKEQSVRAEMLLKQLSSLKFLLRQGLAIRGHDDQEGNLYQLLKLRSQDSVEMQSWLLQGKYLSPVIIVMNR